MNLLYQQHDFPIFQNRMYRTAREAKDCPRDDIRLVEDEQTGLVFNAAFRPELMVYDSHYQNEQGISQLFQEHLGKVACIVEKIMGKDELVEVGCGKGFFLELLLARGFDVTGFDPTYEGSNSRVKACYFTKGLLEWSQGLILRHVLEHIKNPVAFLDHLKSSNGGQGKIYIEVPCFDWICEHHAWFDVFYEHVNYFRLSDFKRMFGEILDSGKLFGGQYLYVVAELATLKNPKIDINDRIKFPLDFTKKITEHNSHEQDKETSKIGAVWGGASKGVIFSLLKGRTGKPVSAIIDINPAKQGKYVAATGLKVISPEAAMASLPKGSTIYVMNSNYLEEIKHLSRNTFNYIGVDSE